MSTSTIPSRTRSLRKSADVGTKYGGAQDEQTTALRPERSSQSPSRLPTMKPAGTRATRSTITSTSAVGRPPSATGSTISNGSMRPPPPRASISKPATTGGLQRSNSNRRPSTTSVTSQADTEPVKKDRSRPPIAISRHLRNASTNSFSASQQQQQPGHSRTRSSSTLSNSTSTTLPPPSNRNSLIEPKAQPQAEPPQLRRPAFSTLQQHFSPAKSLAPKPHPAAFLAPPSPSKLPSNIAISAETAKLQNELLQLHLLHKDAARVEQEWKASAKRKLGVRFHSVVDRNDELVALEVQETGKINAIALRSWRDQGTPGWGLEEQVQVLGEVISGMWNLGDSGGRYARVVRRFERWLRRTQEILEAREYDEAMIDDDVVFLEELDPSWQDDCLVIGRKLELWRDQMRELGQPDTGSGLGLVVEGCQNTVRGMLMELSVMAQVERDAMAREVEWIKSMNDDVSDDDHDPHTAGAIWRSR